MSEVYEQFIISWSPSSRRAWIEIHAGQLPAPGHLVALLAEGVDRNQKVDKPGNTRLMSPSSRRAWIEIDGIYKVRRLL